VEVGSGPKRISLLLAYPSYTSSKRKILIKLPPSGTLARKKQLLLIRIAITLFVILLIVIQLNVTKYGRLIAVQNSFSSSRIAL
jgi:hypothetical protein